MIFFKKYYDFVICWEILKIVIKYENKLLSVRSQSHAGTMCLKLNSKYNIIFLKVNIIELL